MSADERRRFAEACLLATRAMLAEGSPLRAEMEGQGERTLRSLGLEHAGDEMAIVAAVTEHDGIERTERYPLVATAEVDQLAFDIAVAIANV